jgi:transposase InsO family protein
MPWMEHNRMTLRQEFGLLAAVPGTEISALCRRFGISRKTAYKWLGRYQSEGAVGLADRSRRPHGHPWQTPAAMVEQVLAVRAQYGWGGRKIHHALVVQGVVEAPSPSTITAILARHDPDDPVTTLGNPPARWQRFVAARPNDLWQIDFKGPVPVQDGTCAPLLVLDDHSRFVVGVQASPDMQSTTVQAVLTELFHRYGLPARMLGDNGGPWGSSHHGVGVPLTRLTAWLIRLGIAVSHSRPYHPQTQGKIERCFRTLGAEVRTRTATTSRTVLQARFDAWRADYNHLRPHEALDHQPPISRYRLSARSFPAELPPLLYAPSDVLARVSAQGFIRLERKRYFISQVIPGDPVAVRPTADAAIVAIWYGPQFVRFVDLREPS